MPISHVGTVEREVPELGLAVLSYGMDQIAPIAHRILPIILTPEETGKKLFVKTADMAAMKANALAEGANYQRRTARTSSDVYDCEKYGEEAQITIESAYRNRNVLNVRMTHAMQIANSLILGYEDRVALAIDMRTDVTAATFTAVELYDGDKKWNDTGADVIGQIGTLIQTVFENSGFEPNTLVLSRDNLRMLRSNSQILGRFPGATLITNRMIEEALGDIFGISRMLVGKARYNTLPANTTATASMGSIWTDDYVFVCYVDESVTSLENSAPTLGSTMRWSLPQDVLGQQAISGEVTGDFSRLINFAIYPEPQTDSVEVLKGNVYSDEKLWDTSLGALGHVRDTASEE